MRESRVSAAITPIWRKGWRTVVRPGILVGGALDVVKSDDRYVFWHAFARFTESLNGADCGDVVEGQQGREGLTPVQERARHAIADGGRGRVSGELNGELLVNGDTQLLGDGMKGAPADFGVGTEILALDQGDAGVAGFLKVLEGELGGKIVVQHDVGYARDFRMSRDGHSGNERWTQLKRCRQR